MNSTRRDVLKGVSAAGAFALAGFPSILKAQTANNEVLKVGLVGCGGRGIGALTQALNADPNTVCWALGDAFENGVNNALNNTQSYGDRIQTPKERQFVGIDAYQQVIDSGVDVVLLCSPPGFRPQHLRAAVEAGKHVFAEKPVAVDMAGIHSVIESTKLAKEKNVSIQHGFCWRAHPGTRQAYQKVLSGEIGKVTSIYGTYMASPVKPIPPDAVKPAGMGDVEWQMRWWFNYEWLSSGPLVEQCIHTVDKVGWAMGDIAPIAAVGSGGRVAREDSGNIYDHYNVAYEYPGGVFVHVGQRHFAGVHSEVIDRVFCEEGTMFAPGRCSIKDKSGKIVWRSEPDPVEDNMYQVEHNEFFAGIRSGQLINAGDLLASSTALGILGREAAHTGQRITWDQLMASKHDLAPDNLQLGDEFPAAPIPRPGQYQLG